MGTGGCGIGCMGMTAFYGDAMSDEAVVELLKFVYENNCRHFDTAEVYKTKNPMEDDDGIYNEAQIGKFLQTVPRDSFTVATKYFPPRWGDEGKKCTYDIVKKSLLASLKRLGLDYVDLYYCHRIMNLEAAKEFMRSCAKLKEEGLIRAIGLSEICGDWLLQCHSISPVAAIQQEWSLITRGLVEEDLVPVCKQHDITIVAYSPLGRNLLTGVVTETPTDWRADNPRYSPENLAKNRKLLAQVQAIADKYNCSSAQLSLAWLFHKAKQLGVSVLPIPGTTKMKHALSNIQATDISIDDSEMLPLEEIAANVAGERGTDSYTSAGIEAQIATSS
uniref:NADP-dependent oxidoreductase domain-containing protein n=1 Tax=Aureoumbra lagunensis TaxID=44058 RepID=A0A6S8EMQ7_9STRA